MGPLAPLPLRGGYRPLFVGIHAAWGVVFGRGADVARLCLLTDGGTPRGETAFSFVGKVGCFYLAVVFCLPGRGQNHFFFCTAKEKAVLDSEKEKVDRWKSWGGAVQQDRSPTLI